MCGIIGYAGTASAEKVIIKALHALEYRGYDSAGISVFTKNGIRTIKTEGRVSELENKINFSHLPFSVCGIGHTRWATHGKPSEANAHPHGTENVMLVHNGIIENYRELRKILSEKGYRFYSDTDTEVAAGFIDMAYREIQNPEKAIIHAVSQFSGSFAFGIIFRDIPDTIYAVRKDSPLLTGIGKDEKFIASDISAFSEYADKYIRAEDNEIIKITKDSVSITDFSGNRIQRNAIKIISHSATDKTSSFRHFMLKEISEEPEILTDTLNRFTKNDLPDFSKYIDNPDFFSSFSRIHIVACGTAMHAGLTGKYYIERYAGIPVNVETASEFRYSQPIIHSDELVLIISQSGETADSLAALRLVKSMNIPTLAIVNTHGSSIATEAEHVIYTNAGQEIAVASTKAFSAQVIVMMLLALRLALKPQNRTEIQKVIKEIKSCISDSVSYVLKNTADIIKAAEILAENKDVFFIGRGCDNALSQEASLKLKEITYIHSEAYPAGELKHGTISLIDKNMPVVVLAADENNTDKIRNNAEEVRARGAFIISVCSRSNETIKEASDICITVPDENIFVRTLTCSTAVQLLAYHTALLLGRDIDKPRNLAKSVTVE